MLASKQHSPVTGHPQTAKLTMCVTYQLDLHNRLVAQTSRLKQLMSIRTAHSPDYRSQPKIDLTNGQPLPLLTVTLAHASVLERTVLFPQSSLTCPLVGTLRSGYFRPDLIKTDQTQDEFETWSRTVKHMKDSCGDECTMLSDAVRWSTLVQRDGLE